MQHSRQDANAVTPKMNKNSVNTVCHGMGPCNIAKRKNNLNNLCKIYIFIHSNLLLKS